MIEKDDLRAVAFLCDALGDEFVDDVTLRARCEEVYAHHYHDVY